MEVHHHPHIEKKGFKEYLLEGLMIFLAVTLGFFAEGLREHLNDQEKVKDYVRTLADDLRQDTTESRRISSLLFRNIHGQDSLLDLLGHYRGGDSMRRKAYLYFLQYTTLLPEVSYSQRAITQLMNAGNLRLIRNSMVADSIMNYYNSYVENAKSEQEYLKQQFTKTLEISGTVFDFKYLRTPLNESYRFSSHTDFTRDTLRLVSEEPALLKRYTDQVILLQNITGGYTYFVHQTQQAAVRLLGILQKVYSLKE
ncbi:MAG TPA: hypothetical protein VG870_13965 [Chitinophagaceae bacterium]|nr:hypothetical protein [Chitinophagaceae bacterium]